MNFRHLVVAGTLMLVPSLYSFAQANVDHNKEAQQQTKQDYKAAKAQTKADKAEHEAMKSKKVKKAAKAQDKANGEAVKDGVPPQ